MIIDPYISEWSNLIARWIHVFTGILWIGQTYFFTWLDGRLTEEEAELKEGEKAEVWMVHSGGFYVVEKQKTPGTHTLRWFKYEALLTWLSGFFLLVLVYYMGGGLVDADVSDKFIRWYEGVAGGGLKSIFDLSAHYDWFAIVFGLGLLLVAGVVYDLMVRSPLGRNEKVFAVVAYALVVFVTFAVTRVLSGRAAYIHVGAMFGTIMAANVWMHILPGQRKMIAAVKDGKLPDAALAARAKLRSKHNTFMVVPLVFTMISNHFPVATYGSGCDWIVLSVLILAGWIAARFIRRA